MCIYVCVFVDYVCVVVCALCVCCVVSFSGGGKHTYVP